MDVYYALSGFSQGWHTHPTNPQRSVLRTAENSCAQRSLWLDVDIGGENEYANQEEAIANLSSFLGSTGLPQPLIVSSGYGLHLYWPLDRDLPTEEWLQLAGRLKTATVETGFKVDPSRTTDSASILRPPGTFNY